jgi:hypothetical protein
MACVVCRLEGSEGKLAAARETISDLKKMISSLEAKVKKQNPKPAQTLNRPREDDSKPLGQGKAFGDMRPTLNIERKYFTNAKIWSILK